MTPHCDFHLHFPDSDVEHFFIYLLAICMSSFEKCVYSENSYFRDGAVKKPYSAKTLSNKKSSASFGNRRELPSTSHLVQYRGTHTCTRQGRLRELRIRCVARKFLYLWIRMTFGRVFPSKARFYYEQRLLRKVFEEWKEEWWVFHHEWKLCVRADCHYRYYLYNLMFQTWKTYVRQQQEMRNKYIRAQVHDAKQKMRQAWKSWLIYVVVRRTKLQMQTTALEFRQRSILWLWWSMWRQQLGQVRVSRALHASAVKHRALSLQLQAWSQWRKQLLYVQKEKQKVVSAVKHHRHWQKQRFLKAWLEYLQVRRVKRQQNTATGQSGWSFPAENPACCLPHVEETLAMAPAGQCPQCKSNTFPQMEVAVSQDRTTALQPGQQSKIPSQKKKKNGFST
uniref:Protein SFI1 homolog n=1 Tax=Piliocolobus tephrosceles TaxID=591936 RepID=A0A8C9LPN4_9PRIM